jgi:hypothetical protein
MIADVVDLDGRHSCMTVRAADGDVMTYRVSMSDTEGKVTVGDEVVIELVRPLFASAPAAVSASPRIVDRDRPVSAGARATGGATSVSPPGGAITVISRLHSPAAVISSSAERCPTR